MNIEFENSVIRLSILCSLMDVKIAWINPCIFISYQRCFYDKMNLRLFYFHVMIYSTVGCLLVAPPEPLGH